MRLPVYQRHIDIEKPHKRISSIFDTSSHASRRPRHPPCDTNSTKVTRQQYGMIDASNSLDGARYLGLEFRAKKNPAQRIESKSPRGDKLLQCPAPCKPSTGS